MTEPRVDELTTWAAIEQAGIVDRGFRAWWPDVKARFTGRQAAAKAAYAGFRAGFDLARTLLLRKEGGHATRSSDDDDTQRRST